MNSLHLSKKRWQINFLLFVGLSLLFSACARQPKISINIVGESALPADLRERLKETKGLKSFTGIADSIVSYKGFEKKVLLALSVEKPDKIKIDFLDELAGVVARLRAQENYFYYHDAKGTVALTGEEAQGAFRELMRLPWGPKEVVLILFGRLPVEFDPEKNCPVDSGGRYWIAPDRAVSDEDGFVRYIEVNKGRMMVEVDYSGRNKFFGYDFPGHILTTTFKPKLSVELFYNEREFKKK